MALQKGTPVLTEDGKEIGKVDAVVADREKDIFSGLSITPGLFDKDRFVPAERVSTMTEGEVRVTLTAEEAERLEPYEG
jgi:uncharacterized protein YrrD